MCKHINSFQVRTNFYHEQSSTLWDASNYTARSSSKVVTLCVGVCMLLSSLGIFPGPMRRPHLLIKSLFLCFILVIFIKYSWFYWNRLHFYIGGIAVTSVKETRAGREGRKRWINRWTVRRGCSIGLEIIRILMSSLGGIQMNSPGVFCVWMWNNVCTILMIYSMIFSWHKYIDAQLSLY